MNVSSSECAYGLAVKVYGKVSVSSGSSVTLDQIRGLLNVGLAYFMYEDVSISESSSVRLHQIWGTHTHGLAGHTKQKVFLVASTVSLVGISGAGWVYGIANVTDGEISISNGSVLTLE